MTSGRITIPELRAIVSDFALAIVEADRNAPQAVNARSGKAFRPGIGPHTEASAVELIMGELSISYPDKYGHFALNVPYPSSQQKCDVCIGKAPYFDWCIEVKLLRFFGDNGKLNDNILMHILSPYPEHRSALTDCTKLASSGLPGRKAILLYGFDHDGWPLDPAIDAFETLARSRVCLSERHVSTFAGLTHPVHVEGRVFAWEVG